MKSVEHECGPRDVEDFRQVSRFEQACSWRRRGAGLIQQILKVWIPSINSKPASSSAWMPLRSPVSTRADRCRMPAGAALGEDASEQFCFVRACFAIGPVSFQRLETRGRHSELFTIPSKDAPSSRSCCRLNSMWCECLCGAAHKGWSWPVWTNPAAGTGDRRIRHRDISCAPRKCYFVR